jgi:hypothetical protein
MNNRAQAIFHACCASLLAFNLLAFVANSACATTVYD